MLYLLIATAAVFGCRQRDPVELLPPAAGSGSEPSIHFIPLQFDQDPELLISNHDPLGNSFRYSNAPIKNFVYDIDSERILVPGFVAIERTGRVTFEPEPLTGPPGAQTIDVTDLYATWVPPPRDFERHRQTLRYEQKDRNLAGRIMAVWYGTDTITVLCAQNRKTRAHPHAHRIQDSLLVRRLDARTLSLLDDMRLPLSGKLDARESLRRFLRDGTVIVGFGGDRHTRKAARYSWGKIPRTPPGYGLVRLELDGSITGIYPGAWFTATLTGWDEIVLVVPQGRRSQLVGLRPNGTVKFRREREETGYQTRLQSHRDGFCTFDTTVDLPLWTFIACYDRDARLRYRRAVPWFAREWVVDEEGWVYLERRLDPGDPDSSEFVAVTPEGTMAWKLRERRSVGGLLPVGDALCFSPRRLSPSYIDEFVCLTPRHDPNDGRASRDLPYSGFGAYEAPTPPLPPTRPDAFDDARVPAAEPEDAEPPTQLK